MGRTLESMENAKDYVWDDRAPAYLKSGDLAAAIATQHHGLDVDVVTHERWRQLMGLMREVDTWADETSATTDEIRAGLADFTDFQELYPALAPDALEPREQAALLDRTAKILRLGGYAMRATSVERFVALRVAEARESVNLFEDTATRHVTEQPRFATEFMPTLRSLGEAATLWDSLIDGKRDVRFGKQAVKTGPEYYTKVTVAMLERTRSGGSALLHAGPLIHLGIKGGLRLVNRIKRGIPAYSTLRLFQRPK